MKKNYITKLQQFQARSSTLAKQNKYRHKFINTVYDQENRHPNLPQTSQQQSKLQRSITSSSSTEKTKQKVIEHSTSFKNKVSNSRSKGSRVAMNSSNLERKKEQIVQVVQAKKKIEVQKCRIYYQQLRAQLQRKEQQALDLIQSTYSKLTADVQGHLGVLQAQTKAGRSLNSSAYNLQIELAEVRLAEDDSFNYKQPVQTKYTNRRDQRTASYIEGAFIPSLAYQASFSQLWLGGETGGISPSFKQI